MGANSGPGDLAEAPGLVGDDRASRIYRLPAVESWGVPKIRALSKPHISPVFAKLGLRRNKIGPSLTMKAPPRRTAIDRRREWRLARSPFPKSARDLLAQRLY
jgi:hypothetical protein